VANEAFKQTHSQLCQLDVSAWQTYGSDTFTICPEWSMSRSPTTATLRITKRTGAAPQQHCELQNEQELHHSNVAKHKTSRSFTTATLRVSNKSNTENVFVTFTIVPLVVSASQTYGLDTFTICPEWNMSRSHTTATLQITKRARLAPQQHCE
jgi:hypothetical protein